MPRSVGLLALALVGALGAPVAGALAVGDTSLTVEPPHIVDEAAPDPATIANDVESAASTVQKTALGATDAATDVLIPGGPPPESASAAPGSPIEEVAEAAKKNWPLLVLATAIAGFVWTAVQAGLGHGAFPFFSRIQTNRLLENQTRGRIHEAVLNNPGITLKEVASLVGAGWGTTVYHLERLERERLVASTRHHQFRRFFARGAGVANDAKEAVSELRDPTSSRVAQLVADRPGSAQLELCQALGIRAPVASKYLARLEQAQLLTRRREWKFVKYFPTDRLVTLLRPSSALPAPVAVAAAA